MQSPIDFGVTVRGLIIDRQQLLMVKHQPEAAYYALPGGHLDPGETLQDGLTRELIEETAVRPEVGPLLFVNQWLNSSHHRVEFFFWITNASDFRHADPAKASHGFEIADLVFDNAADPKFSLLPSFLQTKFPRLIKLGARYPTELVQSA